MYVYNACMLIILLSMFKRCLSMWKQLGIEYYFKLHLIKNLINFNLNAILI